MRTFTVDKNQMANKPKKRKSFASLCKLDFEKEQLSLSAHIKFFLNNAERMQELKEKNEVLFDLYTDSANGLKNAIEYAKSNMKPKQRLQAKFTHYSVVLLLTKVQK